MIRQALLLLVLLAAAGAHAEDWATTKTVCNEGAHARSFHTLEECAIDLFTLKPVGPVLGNIGAGSGFGAGVHVIKTNGNRTLTLKGLYSIKSSYIASGQYSIAFPPIRT